MSPLSFLREMGSALPGSHSVTPPLLSTRLWPFRVHPFACVIVLSIDRGRFLPETCAPRLKLRCGVSGDCNAKARVPHVRQVAVRMSIHAPQWPSLSSSHPPLRPPHKVETFQFPSIHDDLLTDVLAMLSYPHSYNFYRGFKRVHETLAIYYPCSTTTNWGQSRW